MICHCSVRVNSLACMQLIAPVVALGFEGGHGTAAGIKASFVNLDYPQGQDRGLPLFRV